ncbi:hypothetical protein TNCV_4581271 [Trichonephila clavipes]|nr:hypothetical protein TNCV_4581271 [Trichonephila clavipes]
MFRSSSINFPKGKSNEAKQLIKQKLKRRNPPLSWALGCRCYVTCELYLLANISISSRGDQRDRVQLWTTQRGKLTVKGKKGIKFRLVPLAA